MIKEEERIKMSFGFAADVAKQLIALSTAIITLCVALADKLFSSQAIKSNSTLLLIALGLFFFSVLFGLLCMMAITGTLGKPEAVPAERPGDDAEPVAVQHNQIATNHDPNKGTIYQSNISVLMKIQVFIFLAGIISSVVFLCFSAFSHPKEDALQSKASTERINTIKVERTSNYMVR